MPKHNALESAMALELGKRLRALREERKRTQEQVANEAGLNRNYYQLLESGKGQRQSGTPANPTLATLIALADYYQVPLTELVANLENAS